MKKSATNNNEDKETLQSVDDAAFNLAASIALDFNLSPTTTNCREQEEQEERNNPTTNKNEADAMMAPSSAYTNIGDGAYGISNGEMNRMFQMQGQLPPGSINAFTRDADTGDLVPLALANSPPRPLTVDQIHPEFFKILDIEKRLKEGLTPLQDQILRGYPHTHAFTNRERVGIKAYFNICDIEKRNELLLSKGELKFYGKEISSSSSTSAFLNNHYSGDDDIFHASVKEMAEGIERNGYNHYCHSNKSSRAASRPKCLHETVELWKLDQCQDCKAQLGPVTAM